jgi:hypothetical protein
MVLIAIGIGIALEVSERRQANKKALARKNFQADQPTQHGTISYIEEGIN